MILSTEEISELDRFSKSDASWRQARWFFLVLGVVGVAISITLFALLWELGGTLDAVHRAVQSPEERPDSVVYQLAIVLSLQASAAMLSAALGIQSLGAALVRWRGSPGARVLAILCRRLLEEAGASRPAA